MSSIAMSLPVPAKSRAVSHGRFALLGLATVVAAVVANVLFYFIGSALVAYDPEFLPLATVGETIIMTIFPALAAVLLYAALLRFSRSPARIFCMISAVVFAVSLIPVFTYIRTVPGSTDAQTAILVVMHVIAAGVMVRMLTGSTRSQAR